MFCKQKEPLIRKMHDFFHENFAERVVILPNCPKGCEVKVVNVGQKAVNTWLLLIRE